MSAGSCTARAVDWSPASLFVLPGLVALLILSVDLRRVRLDRGRGVALRRPRAGRAGRSSRRPSSESARRRCAGAAQVTLAVAAFLALTFFAVPFPIVVVSRRTGRVAARPLAARLDQPTLGLRHRRRPAAPDPRRRAASRDSRAGVARCVVLLLGLIVWGVPVAGVGAADRRRAASSRRWACSSPVPPSSRSAAPTPCWPTSRSRPWRSTAGSRRRTWCAVSRSPRRRPAR